MLNEKIKKLLSKLYNLCGKDSIVLVNLEQETNDTSAIKEQSLNSKKELENKISDLNLEKENLSAEGAKLANSLNSIHKDDYKKVLDCLNIDFDPEAMVKKVNKELPQYVENIMNEISENNAELNKVNETLNDAEAKLSELAIRKDEAFATQERLNHYVELALDGSENITRDEVTTILENFDFDQEEQKDLAKLLMFPEDGLLEYDKLFKNNELETSVSDETQNVEEQVVEENIQESEEIVEDSPVLTLEEDKINIVEEEPEVKIEIPVVENETIENNNLDAEEVNITNDEKVSNDILIKKLEELGFDYLDFTSNDFNKMIDNYDEEVFTKNVKFIEEKNIDKEIFLDNIELLYDFEIENKINKLIEIGKLPEDIYLNPSILTKYSFGELNEAIDILNASGLNPKDVPLMAY